MTCVVTLIGIFQKAEMASMETNRAKSVAMNAEVRRTKARLLDEVPKLAKLSQKKVRLIPAFFILRFV